MASGGAAGLLVDLRGGTFIDSLGIAAVVDAVVDELVGVFRSRDEAVEALRQRRPGG